MEISIVIPVYNKAAYLERCLASIFRQDYDDYEIVAVDDGSTDGSAALCDGLAAGNPHLRVVHQPNAGVTAARRRGVETARGRYIVFVDPDDELLPGALAAQHQAIERTGADEVIAPYCTQHGRLRDSGWRGWVDTDVLIADLLKTHNSFAVLWSVIFKRQLLEDCLGAPRVIVEREDILMQFKCLMKKPKVYFAHRPAYRYHEGLPNDRVEDLAMVKAYDQELKATLSPQWERWKSAYVGHQIKVYEKFVDKRQFHVLRDYYKPLRRQLSSDIPLQDRVVIMLPPLVAYPLVHCYKQLRRLLLR